MQNLVCCTNKEPYAMGKSSHLRLETQREQRLEKHKVWTFTLFTAIILIGAQDLRIFFRDLLVNFKLILHCEIPIRIFFLFLIIIAFIFYTSLLLWILMIIISRNQDNNGKYIIPCENLITLSGALSIAGWIIWISHFRLSKSSIDINTLYNNINPANLFIIVTICSLRFNGFMGEKVINTRDPSENFILYPGQKASPDPL
jgi:hypothetical protein